jgi:MOSC domain-containing protein YiiM
MWLLSYLEHDLMSELVSIVYKPQHVDFQHPDRYSRLPLEDARLIENHGIECDRKGSQPARGLNIMSSETLAALAKEGYKTNPGEMGEQLIISGLDVDALAAGDRLQIGPAATVEIIEPRTGCDRFERIQGLTRQQAAGRMGMMAKVVTGGTIRIGDTVAVLQKVNV